MASASVVWTNKDTERLADWVWREDREYRVGDLLFAELDEQVQKMLDMKWVKRVKKTTFGTPVLRLTETGLRNLQPIWMKLALQGRLLKTYNAVAMEEDL